MCEKVRFAKRPEALARLAEIQAKGERRENMPIREYYCSECGGYHLTKQKMSKKKRNIINERKKNFPRVVAQAWAEKKGWEDLK